MLVILKESVRKLGKAGEAVKVKPGYARNFLLPCNKAMWATKENLATLEKQRSLLEEENTKKLGLAKDMELSLSGKFVILVRQASEDGRLFGSVTTRNIATALAEEGHNINYHNLSFVEKSIKNLGEYTVKAELHAEVIVLITLYVVRSNTDVNELRKVKLQAHKA